MRLAFWLPRSTHLKILCPIAAAARQRGDHCLALYPSGTLKGPKDDARPAVGVDPALVPFDAAREVADEVDAEIHLRNVDWTVAVGLRTAPAIRAYTRVSGIRWIALDGLGDNLLYILESGKDALADWDLAVTLATDPRTFTAQELLGTPGYDYAAAETTAGMPAIGYPELDQLALPGMTREACREKWNLPERQKIILFAPAARPANLTRLHRWWWGRTDYPFIARQVRRFSDRHGALLLTKTRAKHRDPPWLAGLSGRVVGETCYYPFDTLELLVACDLVVGFVSTLAVETAAVGRPQVWLHAWPPEDSEWPKNLPIRKAFFLAQGGLWNHAGARAMNCFGPRWREHLRHWAELGAWPVLTDQGRAAMRGALERWAGAVDGQASTRFLDLLESR